MKKILHSREFFMACILVGISLLISFIAPSFLSIDNLLNIVMNNIILAIMALGMTLVIVTSGIDVSVGSQLGFAAIFVGLMAINSSSNMFMVLIVGIICGILLGLINGILIAGAEIPPIVVTLGMLSIYRGGILLYTKGKWVTNLPEWYRALYNSRLFGIPVPIWFLLGVFLATYWLARYTRLGRSIYALGGNKIAAKRVGIDLGKINLFVFAYMGLLTGIASILYGSQLGVIDPNAGTGFEMTVIAAVVIGGANILGGSGSFIGTLIGVMVLGVLQNGMVLMHIETYWQDVVMGLLIILTVSIDVVKHQRTEASKNSIDVEGEDQYVKGGKAYEANVEVQ
jgi:ribose/xylose/arabinose/galactoside ABC-type transport system permease subunit